MTGYAQSISISYQTKSEMKQISGQLGMMQYVRHSMSKAYFKELKITISSPMFSTLFPFLRDNWIKKKRFPLAAQQHWGALP